MIDDDTTIVTTVNPLQVSDKDLPEATHDFRVDIIVTTDEVLRCDRHKRPPGIIWDHLDSDKVAAIPALAGRP